MTKPFFENRSPLPGTINPKNTNISITCVDYNNEIDTSTIEIDIQSADAYRSTGFSAAFNGTSSSFTFIPNGSIDGYDAYQIIIDPITDFNYNQVVSVGASVKNINNQIGSSTWMFKIESPPGTPPELANISPVPNSDIATNGLISFNIFDPNNNLDAYSIEIKVNNITAYNSGFTSQFSSSTINPTLVDGYDGYSFTIDYSGYYSSITTVSVYAEDSYGYILNQSWGYISSQGLNRLYYSDDYGVCKINLEDLVGESQFVSNRFLTTTTSPSIPINKVSSITGNHIDGYSFLTLSMKGGLDGYHYWGEFEWGYMVWGGLGHGVFIVKNETEMNQYANGYACDKAYLTSDGKLYLINKTLNRIEVYYGADKRNGFERSPDFFYDAYSTPPLYSDSYDTGELLTIHIVEDDSNTLTNGTKIYVGQEIGMTIIDAYDKEIAPGYSAGEDGYGTTTFCGIVGSGATHECIGGTIPRVIDIETDARYSVAFVVTNDGLGDGGLSQISLPNYINIIFMTEDTGFVPSNDIRDASKNE